MYLDIFHIDGQGRSQIVYQKHWKQVNPRSEALGLWFSLTLCYYCIRGKKALPKKCIYVISWEGEKVNGCIEGLAWDEGWMLGRQCNQYCADVNDTMSVTFYKIGWRSFSSSPNLIHLFKFWWLPVNNRKSLLQSKLDQVHLACRTHL